MNLGNLFKRFWSYFFDLVIVFGIYLGILLLLEIYANQNVTVELLKEIYKISSKGFSLETIKENTHYIVIFYLTYALLFLLYEIVFLSSKLSSTPGKSLLSLEVACFKKVSFLKVFTRSLVKIISTLITPLTFLSFLVAAFTKTKQSFHDKLANTYVISIKKMPQRGSKPKMTSEEFFEEMKSRGLTLYSEQKALADEIYGSQTIELDKSSSASKFVSVLVLLVSIILCLCFVSFSYPDLQNYINDFNSQYTQKQ